MVGVQLAENMNEQKTTIFSLFFAFYFQWYFAGILLAVMQ